MTKSEEFRRLANVYVATTVAMVGILLIWNISMSISLFKSHQSELAERSIHAAADEIELLINGYRRSLQIFADENRETINSVALWPQDIDSYTILKNKISRYFPEHFAFTLANQDGYTLLYGFERQIGDACRADIHSFTAGVGDNQVYVHRGAGEDKKHFDIMSIWQGTATYREVMFVSFRTGSLERILGNTEVAGHHIALVLSDQPDRIDLTTPQNHLVFSEDRVLTPDEQERVTGSLQIPGTRWNVVILPNEQLYSETYRSIVVQSLLIFVGFLLISLIMRMMLLDDQVK